MINKKDKKKIKVVKRKGEFGDNSFDNISKERVEEIKKIIKLNKKIKDF